jgi:hypothetical protein
VVETQEYPAERSLSIGCQKVLEKLFKNVRKYRSYEDGKSPFERSGRERNRGALHPFLRERERYHSPAVFCWLTILLL